MASNLSFYPQLDVQIYTTILRDRIEWDLSSRLPPSHFAKHYCRDLGLTGEAIPLITHALHEEILKHLKDCLELELFLGSHPEQQLRFERSGINPKVGFSGGSRRLGGGKGGEGLKGVWRDWWELEEFSPTFYELSMDEMERREQERMREARWVFSSFLLRAILFPPSFRFFLRLGFPIVEIWII